MRFHGLAAAIAVALTIGITDLQAAAAPETSASSTSRTDRPAVKRTSPRLNIGRLKTRRRFWASWPYGGVAARPWPYTYPYASYRNYWTEWNIDGYYRDPNRYVVHTYNSVYFPHRPPYPFSVYYFPNGF